MSLILEALRKSEAERQRGRVPAIAAEPAVPAPAHHGTPPWAWLFGGAGVLAIAGAAWLVAGSRDRIPAAPAPTAAAIAQPASAPAPAAPTPTPAATSDAPHASPPAPAALPPVARLEPAPAPATPAPAPPLAAPALATGLAARVPSASASTAPATAAVIPLTGAALLLADLDPDSRKALPPLRLSMHLWDADPARRFVILDGARLAEGDRVGPAVLTEITRDGALLDWNGRRIRLPLR